MTTLASPRASVKPSTPRTRKAPERHAHLTGLPGGSRVLFLTVGEVTTAYWVSPIAADYGQAFRVEKFGCMGGESYTVHLGDDETPASCECKGHLRWGHRTVCKHLAALQALRQAGKL